MKSLPIPSSTQILHPFLSIHTFIIRFNTFARKKTKMKRSQLKTLRVKVLELLPFYNILSAERGTQPQGRPLPTALPGTGPELVPPQRGHGYYWLLSLPLSNTASAESSFAIKKLKATRTKR